MRKLHHRKMIAMLLAGGKGTRLSELTREIAKPAVYYGGKYRIIDFSLSNCSNSGIDTIGVLTQYESLILNSYIGNGSAWDLDGFLGGVTLLPPYSTGDDIMWYSGTASAVALNSRYIDYYNPDYVLILSGDHVYKMDYSKMLDFHIQKQADLTIASIEVPIEEASRFGILEVDDNQYIKQFVEKPQYPTSHLASMGIYIFNWATLKQLLKRDLEDETSSHDFGKDVIPYALNNGYQLYAYPYSGYWRDVGTVKSLWEANMDLLDDHYLNLFSSDWPIFSVNHYLPPHKIYPTSKIHHALIDKGCMIKGDVYNSIISYNVTLLEGSSISNSVIMPNVIISKQCDLKYCIVQSDLVIPNNTVIHGSKQNIILVSKSYIKLLEEVG